MPWSGIFFRLLQKTLLMNKTPKTAKGKRLNVVDVKFIDQAQLSGIWIFSSIDCTKVLRYRIEDRSVSQAMDLKITIDHEICSSLSIKTLVVSTQKIGQKSLLWNNLPTQLKMRNTYVFLINQKAFVFWSFHSIIVEDYLIFNLTFFSERY